MTFSFGSLRCWVWFSLLLLSPTGLVVKIVSQDVGSPDPAPSCAQGRLQALAALSAPHVKTLPFSYRVHKYFSGQISESLWPQRSPCISRGQKGLSYPQSNNYWISNAKTFPAAHSLPPRLLNLGVQGVSTSLLPGCSGLAGDRHVGTLMTGGVERQEVTELHPYRVRAGCCDYK